MLFIYHNVQISILIIIAEEDAMRRVLATVIMTFLLLAIAQPVKADDKRILDVLLKKGIISQQEYDQILKEAKEPFKGPVVEETLKDETPTVSTEEAKPGAKRPPPVGSYADRETRR